MVNCYSYPCPPQPEPKIVGYSASQSISVKIRNVDTANQVSTGLAEVGITNISGPTFTIDDEDVYKENARAQAIVDAQVQAKVLASQLHVRLGDIVTFSENGSGYQPMMYEKSDMMSANAGAPAPTLPKGENKINSNVTITYEIR